MLIFLYTCFFIFNLLIILFRKSKLDFITIYFLSSAIYYVNLFFGEIYTRYSNVISGYEINEKTYFVMIMNMSLILVFFVFSKVNFSKKKIEANLTDIHNINSFRFEEKKAINILSFITFLLAVYMVIQFRLFTLVEFNKIDVLNSSGTVEYYFKAIALFLFVYIFTQKQIKYSFYTYLYILFSIFTTFMLGHRSYIVIGILAILFDKIANSVQKENNLISYLLKNKKIVMFVLLFIFFVYSIKGVYVALFTKQFDLVVSRLTSWEYYINTFKISESNTILRYVDVIASTNFRVDSSTYLIVISYFIPVISRLFEANTFSDILHQNFFSEAQAGTLGSSFIAEALANGGTVLLVIMLILLLSLLKWASHMYTKCKTSYTKTFLLLLGIEFSFYIHRNGLGVGVLRIRSYLYILLLIIFLIFIFKILSRKSRTSKHKNNKDMSSLNK